MNHVGDIGGDENCKKGIESLRRYKTRARYQRHYLLLHRSPCSLARAHVCRFEVLAVKEVRGLIRMQFQNKEG